MKSFTPDEKHQNMIIEINNFHENGIIWRIKRGNLGNNIDKNKFKTFSELLENKYLSPAGYEPVKDDIDDIWYIEIKPGTSIDKILTETGYRLKDGPKLENLQFQLDTIPEVEIKNKLLQAVNEKLIHNATDTIKFFNISIEDADCNPPIRCDLGRDIFDMIFILIRDGFLTGKIIGEKANEPKSLFKDQKHIISSFGSLEITSTGKEYLNNIKIKDEVDITKLNDYKYYKRTRRIKVKLLKECENYYHKINIGEEKRLVIDKVNQPNKYALLKYLFEINYLKIEAFRQISSDLYILDEIYPLTEEGREYVNIPLHQIIKSKTWWVVIIFIIGAIIYAITFIISNWDNINKIKEETKIEHNKN